jgi:hypothetical protein
MVSRVPVSARRAAGGSEDSPGRSTLFLSRLDPEDGRVLVSVFPHIIKYQLFSREDPVVDRVLSLIVWLFFDLSVQVGMDPNCLWLNSREMDSQISRLHQGVL